MYSRTIEQELYSDIKSKVKLLRTIAREDDGSDDTVFRARSHDEPIMQKHSEHYKKWAKDHHIAAMDGYGTVVYGVNKKTGSISSCHHNGTIRHNLGKEELLQDFAPTDFWPDEGIMKVKTKTPVYIKGHKLPFIKHTTTTRVPMYSDAVKKEIEISNKNRKVIENYFN